jgi:hypothetical protein
VDEAAQALEAECLIPLSLAGSHTKIILSGDHMQVRDFHFYYRIMLIQWNLSNLTHQGTGEMCWIVQDVGILRFYFN